MVCNKLCVSQENMSTHQRLDEITVKVKEIRQLTGVRWDWMVNEATFYFWEIFIFSEHTDRFQILFGKFIGAIKIPISALSRSKKTMEEINLWNLNHSWKKKPMTPKTSCPKAGKPNMTRFIPDVHPNPWFFYKYVSANNWIF